MTSGAFKFQPLAFSFQITLSNLTFPVALNVQAACLPNTSIQMSWQPPQANDFKWTSGFPFQNKMIFSSTNELSSPSSHQTDQVHGVTSKSFPLPHSVANELFLVLSAWRHSSDHIPSPTPLVHSFRWAVWEKGGLKLIMWAEPWTERLQFPLLGAISWVRSDICTLQGRACLRWDCSRCLEGKVNCLCLCFSND